MIRVLVACEESQAVTKAFRDAGCLAFSCDVQECSGGHPEWHILGDALQYIDGNCEFDTCDGNHHVIDGRFDLLIAHPPCTYLSNAGACRLYPRKGELNMERYAKGMEAKEFFMQFYGANCEHIAIENPIPSRVFELPPYTQTIQPYEFGHPYTKRTCLWLINLPKLLPTDIVEPLGPYVCGNADIWKKQAAKGVVYGKEKSPKHRSKTFSGVAVAMAQQWTKHLKGE